MKWWLFVLQQRHRSDAQVNNRVSYVLRHGDLVEERWHKVSVGDIIRLKNNDFVAVSSLNIIASGSRLFLSSLIYPVVWLTVGAPL